MVLKISLDTKMVKLLNHYVLFYLRWVNLLNVLKTKKKKTSFLADDDDVILKYNKIWKKKLKSYFDSQPVYDEKYVEIRVKPFEDKVIMKFTDNEIPKENTHDNLCWFCNKIRKRELSLRQSWIL